MRDKEEQQIERRRAHERTDSRDRKPTRATERKGKRKTIQTQKTDLRDREKHKLKDETRTEDRFA